MTLVHGDDYASVGDAEQLQWLKKELEKRFDIKTTIVGHDDGDEGEGKILNRVVRATAGGWEYEADLRHAELLVEQMGLGDAKEISTPGVDENEPQPGDEAEISAHEVSMHS